jgi:NADPH:quinone reductase-like Zn-dependent oxidoreductase
MRVVEIPRYGPPHVLQVVDRPDPELDPAEGQVLVQVRAAGVNFADLMMRMGLYPEAPRPPFVPGFEVAGIAEGRAVMAVTRFGGYAEKVAVPRAKLMTLPRGLNFEEGAAIPVNYLTAWCALEELARVRAGDRVLIHGAAGGVGLAAVQLARRRTDRVTGSVGDETKARFLRDMGVNAVVRGRGEPEGPFDAILNPVGGRSILRDLDRLAPLGRIVCYGASDVVGGEKRSVVRALRFLLSQPRFKPIELMHRNAGVMGLNLLRLWDQEELLARAARELASIEGLRPRVDRAFPLAEAAEAHRHLHARRNIGKVVLAVAPDSR